MAHETEALEMAWAALRQSHPELPAVAIMLGIRGRDDGGETLASDAVMISADRLEQGGGAVFATLAHHSAHVLASVRGIRDVSGDYGRYHNSRFAELAREIGLDVMRGKTYGYARVSVPAEMAGRYEPVIAGLDDALAGYKAPAARATPWVSRIVARCACNPPRSMWMSPLAYDLGGIRCELCNQRFSEPAE